MSPEFKQLPEEEIKFGFVTGTYHGPVSDPTNRPEIAEYDLEQEVEDLLKGIVPERFSWMQPVVDDQLARKKVNTPLRFMAVVSELARAQAESERDMEYEHQVMALGQLLYDACDENFNYLGFFVKVKDGEDQVHNYEWGRLKLDDETQTWQLPDGLPVTEVKEIVRHTLS